MQGKLHNLDPLIDGKSPEQLRKEAVEFLNESSVQLSQDDERQITLKRINKARKEKADYRLFSVYQPIREMEKQIASTMDELIFKNENGDWEKTECYNVLASLKPEYQKMLIEMETLWLPNAGKVDQLKASWIKERVIQTRFSRRGQHYVEQLQKISDDLFSLSTLCINVQLLLNDLTKDLENV